MKSAVRSIGLILAVIPLTALPAAFPVLAQSIVPTADGTGTTVRSTGKQLDISGGSLSGDRTNLFHSFQQFGVSQGEIANFLSQPGIQNILARVRGGNPSIINGLIQISGGGNPHLYLMNPAGIIFGTGASLNVPASFTATTATGIGFGTPPFLTPGWFSATGSNNYPALLGTPSSFAFSTSAPGSIVNAGHLSVNSEQNLTLLGGTVVNTGQLLAPQGNITLTAVPGSSFVRLEQAGNLLNLEIQPITAASSQPESWQFPILSLPQLLTGGNLSNATNLKANSDGTVQLTGSAISVPTDAGTAIVSGSLDVSGQKGGTVQVLGDKVGLIGANLNAAGTLGGGSVRIGGDYQGKGTLPNASHTFVSSDSLINAAGLLNGDGGRVIVWADKVTDFYGNISTRGGMNSGNGGFVEVSGKESLLFAGTVDTLAQNGKVGTLLLDPKNILITAAGPDPVGGQIFGNPTGTSTISGSSLSTALMTSTVTLQANNDITVDDKVQTTTPNNGLTLQAGRSITINSGKEIKLTQGNFSATINDQSADPVNRDAGAAQFRMDTGSKIITRGGNITVSAGTADPTAATINTTLGELNANSELYFNNSGAISLTANGDITTGTLLAQGANNGGSITLTSTAGSISTTNNISSNAASGNGGNIILNAGSGNITLSGSIDTSSGKQSAGNIVFTGNVKLNTSAAITTTGGTSGGNITFNNQLDGTIAGNNTLTLKSGNGKITFNGIGNSIPLSTLTIDGTTGDIQLAGNYNFPQGYTFSNQVNLIDNTTINAGEILAFNKLAAGTNNLTLKADQIDFNGAANSVSGTGKLVLQPATASRDISIGGSATANALALTTTDIAALKNGFNPITIGRPDGSGIISVNPVTFQDSVQIQSPSGVINVNGEITGKGSVTLSGKTNLLAGITTTDKDIIINGNTWLGNDITLSTLSNGGGNILVNGTIDGSKNLTLETGSGNIALNGAVGNTSRLENLNINSAKNITAQAITAASIIQSSGTGITIFNGTLNTNTASGINLTGKNFTFNSSVTTSNGGGVTITNSEPLSIASGAGMNLDGAFSQNGLGSVSLGRNITAKGSITFNSPVTLTDNVFLDTSASGSDIIFNNTVNNTLNNTVDGRSSLTLAAGTGKINFGGAVGNSTRLGNLTIKNAGEVQAGAITASSITQSSGTGTTTFNGVLSTDGAGGINLQGYNFTLNESVTATAGGQVTVRAKNNITTSSITANAGITLNSSDGAINTSAGTLDSKSSNSNGGAIALWTFNGSITTGNLDSSGAINGGNIEIQASTQIAAGKIDSSGIAGKGGNVTLDPSGDIQVTSINASGGTTGGTVDITTKRFFRATDSFTTPNCASASICTTGGTGGGSITIRHMGGITTPFIIGNPSLPSQDGTAGAITAGGADNTISNFTVPVPPDTYKQGNIQIITPAPIPQPQLPPLPHPVSPPNSLGTVAIKGAPPPQERPVSQLLPPSSVPELKINERIFFAIEYNLTKDFQRYFEQTGSNGNSGQTHNNPPWKPIYNNSDSGATDQENPGNTNGIVLQNLKTATETLRLAQENTGVKPALIYVVFEPQTIPPESKPSSPQAAVDQTQSVGSEEPTAHSAQQPNDKLQLLLVTTKGEAILKQVNVTRSQVFSVAEEFRTGVTRRTGVRYLLPAQQLYQWMVAPLEADLKARGIQNLVFVLDVGLRSVPLAALHDGKGFLIERYSVGLIPSLSLTDTRYADIKNAEVLAMGVSQFTNQKPLPGVPEELSLITQKVRSGKSFLNEAFTLKNLKAQRQKVPFTMIHLATHAEFQSGEPANSYIQLWDTKLRLDQLRQLGWNNPPVELLVLSACRTALGDQEAEYGFAGLAVQAGVKSALGSLWYVSDEGTLGLMSESYQQLKTAPIKAEALRQAQLAMLRGQVRIEDGQLVTPSAHFPLPPNLEGVKNKKFSHPYYWSAFTIVGSPW